MSRLDPQSTSDLLRTILMVARKLGDDDYGCFLFSAAPAFQEDVCGLVVRRPGMVKFRGSTVEAKELVHRFHLLGYYVLLYKYDELSSWYSSLDALPAYREPLQEQPLLEIAEHLPPHQTYVELFGSGSPMFAAKAPANVEVYNDVYSHVVNLFRILRYPETLGKFFLLSRLFPPTQPMEESQLRSHVRYAEESDLVLLAYSWFMHTYPVLSAFVGAQSQQTALLFDGNTSEVADALIAIDSNFLLFRDRLMRMQFEYNDWRRVLTTYDTDKTLFWVDVPTSGQHALTPEECGLLVNHLTSCGGSAIVYINAEDRHEILDELLASEASKRRSRWKLIEFSSCWIYRKA